MATLTVSPNPSRRGQPVTLLGADFTASTPVGIRIDSEGFFAEIASNAGGLVSNDDIGDHATALLTNTGNPANNDTVTIGSRVYTFKTTLTPAADEVLIGASASASFDNLKAAVNGGAGSGTAYAAATVAHADVVAGEKTATTLRFHARLAGTDGNALASAESSTVLSFGGANFAGGAGDPTGFKTMDWRPTREGTYTIIASDGTNSATAIARIFESA